MSPTHASKSKATTHSLRSPFITWTHRAVVDLGMLTRLAFRRPLVEIPPRPKFIDFPSQLNYFHLFTGAPLKNFARHSVPLFDLFSLLCEQ